ncbi:hypothetical protein AAJ76_3700027729 [Vairimorpha ceranae]|uniref:Uncharacterized protein n=1 Tax=Vairimorpha ceranae TaxID=40302 RepID=A0A0F9ZBB0_9MICR|nr:hypothetical protein AAJ76_3700027729 [Vairimorpha ceranae]KAF5140771.1 hypothetical protein G9O61_00g010910 [Vairimorpha ceranae]KKO74974.1 hypothetical protein AAJ76_3700027729 [Vairimorpha ceranae]
MNGDKKLLSCVKVGGRRVIKKSLSSSNTLLNNILENNKDIFTKSVVDELSIERNNKIYKYKKNIKLVFDKNKKPIGFFVSGFPEIKNKIVTDVPLDFEKAVENLNLDFVEKNPELEKYLGIE